MDYTVEIAIAARRPLTEDALFEVAEIGGAAAGNVGERRLETTLTVTAKSPSLAAALAIDKVTARVAGEVIAINVMTIDEADRRLEERTELVGIGEIAEYLGVSKQRVSTLSKRKDFPGPIAKLAAGPVWRKSDLSTFAMGWRRKPGPRPQASKAIAAPQARALS